MTNVANIADYRASEFAPANDAGPSDAAPSARTRAVRSVLGSAFRVLAIGLLKTARLLAFVILSTFRGLIRVLLSIMIFGMMLGLPMFWFGYPDGSHEQRLFSSIAIGVIIGGGLFRHFYDELLLALDPRARRYDD